MDYHDRMMNIPATDGEITDAIAEAQRIAETYDKDMRSDKQLELLYKIGHRDARHAAAEIALEADRRLRDLQDQIRDARDVITDLEEQLSERERGG